MATLLCALCENTSVTIDHSQNNIFGYLGFGLIVALMVIDTIKKKKANKEAE